MRHMHIRALEESGLSAADEMLYPDNWSYVSDFLSYVAIGARSVENQQHRLTVSGIDIPVGMKNPTSGDLSVMLNSVIAAQNGHTFIYRGKETHSTGNPLAHTVLRGATNKHGNAIPQLSLRGPGTAAGQVRADRPEKSGCHRRYQPLQLQQKIRTADPHHPGGTAKPPLRSTDLCPGKGPHDRKLSGARSPEDRLRPAHLRQIHHRSLPWAGRNPSG